MIKVAFCSPKKLADSDVWVLSTSSFNIEQFMFKLTMISNACVEMAKLIDMNLLTHLWRIFSASKLVVCSFPKYFKLAKIWCGSLSSQFNSLLMQKLELGPILGFWQPCNLQRFVGFFYGSW